MAQTHWMDMTAPAACGARSLVTLVNGNIVFDVGDSIFDLHGILLFLYFQN